MRASPCLALTVYLPVNPVSTRRNTQSSAAACLAMIGVRNERENLLLRWVLDEVDALLNVALELAVAGLQQLLLVLVGGADDVVRLDSTLLAELDRHGEVIAAGLLRDRVTALDTWEVDKGALDDTGLALGGLHDALSEAVACVGHAEGSRARTVLGLDDFVTTLLDAWGQSISSAHSRS